MFPPRQCRLARPLADDDRPVVEGDVFEVLRKVQRGEFASPRQLDPSIDRALEAVCVGAMATRPEDRYASCRALAP